jgi:DNA-binding SARP family transcriptional activator/tetratricopeptide (TPR) repeat protein
MTEFRVLGPVEIWAAGRAVDAGHARQRAVLAVLLLEVGRVVSAETLIDRVWGEKPPASVRNVLYGYVTRLRKAIAAAGDPDVMLVRRPGGYQLAFGKDQLDLCCFRGLVAAAGTGQRAGVLLQEAGYLWRGTALAGVESPWLERMREVLEEERAAALLDLNDIRLRQGEHAILAGELAGQAVAAPGDERLVGQLMLALHRSGRQAEALRWFERTRQFLAGELGVDPGPGLRGLHGQILRADPVLALVAGPVGVTAGDTSPPSGSVPGATGRSGVPRQLPAVVRHFVGRAGELEVLSGLVKQEPVAGRTVVAVIDGMAGVGKTALAVYAAQRYAGQFPDGQLFIDLHGYTQGHRPRPAAYALEVFLRALGVPPQHIPPDLDECAALYRSELAGRRMLIVLDNAATGAQVRPLVPGAAGCLVLVTSRRRLKSLDQVHVLSLGVLPQDDSIGLLRAVAGADHLAAGDLVLAGICDMCGRLPLALSIAGSLLRHRPAWSPQHLAGLLRDHRQVSAFADEERDLGAVFGLSYRALGESQQYLFRCLGLVPGPDADEYAAAALTGADLAGTGQLLEELVDHNLLIERAPGRYRLHDLLRLQAAALVASDPPADRDAALGRLLDYYQHTAQRADVMICRDPMPELPAASAPAHLPVLADPSAARTWLHAERANLLAAVQYAAGQAHQRRVIGLTAGLATVMRMDAPWSRAISLYAAAGTAARGIGDRLGQANALTLLGNTRGLSGDFPGAARDLEQALGLYQDLGERLGQASALTRLAYMRGLSGDFPGAARDLEQALGLYQDLGERLGQANVLAKMGDVQRMTGDWVNAAGNLRRAIDLYQDLGHQSGHGNALIRLADTHAKTGDYPQAAHELEQATQIFQDTGRQPGQADALTRLGELRRETGDYQGAIRDLRQALDIFQSLQNSPVGPVTALTFLAQAQSAAGDPAGALSTAEQAADLVRRISSPGIRAWVLRHYAAVVSASGESPRALDIYQEALGLARTARQPDDEAFALEGIGECHLLSGDTQAGLTHFGQALQTFQQLAMKPDVDRVQHRLAAIHSG